MDLNNTTWINTENSKDISLRLCRHIRRQQDQTDVNLVQNASLTNVTLNGHGGGLDAHNLDWFELAISVICTLGIIGNVLNLLVLTRRRMLCAMDRLEKSAMYGLVALAFSDMMFCVSVLPHTFVSQRETYADWENVFALYYKIFGIGCINLFLTTSILLVVSMAVNRYIVVVYPFQARRVLGSFRTIMTIVLIYICSLAITLPYFLHIKVRPCSTQNGDTMYELASRWSKPSNASRNMRTYLNWVWPIVAVFIPVTILAFVNIRLIQTLRLATRLRRRSCEGQRLRNSSHKVTLTLVIIVLMILVLVAPSEILRYANPYRSLGKHGEVIATTFNVLQTVNFAFNFVLYCAVNAAFRNTLRSFCQSWCFCFKAGQDKTSELHTMLSPTSINKDMDGLEGAPTSKTNSSNKDDHGGPSNTRRNEWKPDALTENNKF